MGLLNFQRMVPKVIQGLVASALHYITLDYVTLDYNYNYKNITLNVWKTLVTHF